MRLSAPSFSDLIFKVNDFVDRNASLSSEKVWDSMLLIYGEYIEELGWELKLFKEQVFESIYLNAH